jgi:hypothetical protein
MEKIWRDYISAPYNLEEAASKAMRRGEQLTATTYVLTKQEMLASAQYTDILTQFTAVRRAKRKALLDDNIARGGDLDLLLVKWYGQLDDKGRAYEPSSPQGWQMRRELHGH